MLAGVFGVLDYIVDMKIVRFRMLSSDVVPHAQY